MSPNHRRVLSVRMRLLENDCRQLLELLRPAAPGGSPAETLPAEKAQKVERALRNFLSRISQIRTELELDDVQQNVRRAAAALVAGMRTNVEELDPRYLKGYGAVPDPLARYLQECLQGLEEPLRAVSRILADGAQAPPPEAES